MKTLFFLSITVFSPLFVAAQGPLPSNATCHQALNINGCGNVPQIIPLSPGQGDPNFIQDGVNAGCIVDPSLDYNFSFFYFQAQANGKFGFAVESANPNLATDIDFNVWGPISNVAQICNFVSNNQPIRSSFDEGSDLTGLADVHPVFGNAVTDNFDCGSPATPGTDPPFGTADDFVRRINVQIGEIYVIMLDDFDGTIENDGIAIDFSGTSNGVLGLSNTTITVSNDTFFCPGLPVQLQVNGGLTYAWSPATGLSCFDCPNPFASPNATTTYEVTVVDVCETVTKFVTVALLPLPAFSLGQDTVVCASQLPLALAAPGTALWQDGSSANIFAAAQPGLYWAEFTGANGCQFRDSLTLALKPSAQTQSSAQPCHGQPYVWNGQAFSTDTTVCATFSGLNGCDSTHCLTLTFFYPLIALDTSICSGQTLAWLGTDYSTSGIYADTVLLGGCLTATHLDLEILPIAAELLSGDPLCHGDSTGFVELTNITGGIGTVSFSLNGGAPTNMPMFGDLPEGNWEVLATDAAGCTATFSFELVDPPALAVELGQSPELIVGDTYAIPVQVNQSGVFQYAWSPPDGLDCSDCPNPVATASEEITYTLLLTNAAGCEAAALLLIRIQEGEIYVPNIFSPDGDGQNDWLTIFGNPAQRLAIDLFSVYNRWGELIFETRSLGLNDEQSGWDGRQKGRPVLPGVYVWLADIRMADGSLLHKHGEVAVLR